jgi:hypothetical protein
MQGKFRSKFSKMTLEEMVSIFKIIDKHHQILKATSIKKKNGKQIETIDGN